MIFCWCDPLNRSVPATHAVTITWPIPIKETERKSTFLSCRKCAYTYLFVANKPVSITPIAVPGPYYAAALLKHGNKEAAMQFMKGELTANA